MLQSLAAVIQMRMTMTQAKVFSDYGTSLDAEKIKPGCFTLKIRHDSTGSFFM